MLLMIQKGLQMFTTTFTVTVIFYFQLLLFSFNWIINLNKQNIYFYFSIGSLGLSIKMKKSTVTPGAHTNVYAKNVAPGGSAERGGVKGCLLYTSPSPRDRG